MKYFSSLTRSIRYRFFDWRAGCNSWSVQTRPWGDGDEIIVQPFVRPIGISVGSDGHVYVADFDAHRVIRFDHEWRFRGWLGRLRAGVGQGQSGWQMASGGARRGDAPGAFQRPHAIAFDDDGDLLVTELDNLRVQRFSLDGHSLAMVPAGDLPDGAPPMAGPVTCTPGPDGVLYVTDFRGHSIHRFDHQGRFTGWIGAGETGPTEGFVMTGRPVPSFVPGGFNKPHVMRIAQDGWLLVADTWNHRIVRFTPQGRFDGWLGADVDGPGGLWRSEGVAVASPEVGGFDAPTDFCLLDDGSMIVAEYGNHRLQLFSAAGEPNGWLGGDRNGQATGGWRMDGIAAPSRSPGAFRHPYALAVSGCRLYVADTENGRIQVFPHG